MKGERIKMIREERYSRQLISFKRLITKMCRNRGIKQKNVAIMIINSSLIDSNRILWCAKWKLEEKRSHTVGLCNFNFISMNRRFAWKYLSPLADNQLNLFDEAIARNWISNVSSNSKEWINDKYRIRVRRSNALTIPVLCTLSLKLDG